MKTLPRKPLISTRLYYLDWLRVIAFSLLIVYHAGLMFVDWGYHIQNETLSEGLKGPMLFLNQWRLPLLFFISGVGVKFSFKRRSTAQFTKERFLRLFIPLISGILLVVPVQIYYERLYSGAFAGNYLEFYPQFFSGIYPEGNFSWGHLWFLVYLLTYVLIALPIFTLLNSDWGKTLLNSISKFLQKPFILLTFFAIPLIIIELTLREKWPDQRILISDWYNFSLYLSLLLCGYFVASSESLWVVFERDRWIYLILAILSFLLIYLGWHQSGINFLETSRTGYYFFHAGKIINLLAWIFVCLGFARKHLKRPMRYLPYANQSVYPVFILHQSVLIGLGFYILPLSIGIFGKLILIIIATFVVSLALNHWIVLKVNFLRTLFGVKPIIKA